MINSLINDIKDDMVYAIKDLIKEDLNKIILFGSYARGDNNSDSDIDVAVMINSDRDRISEYSRGLVSISTDIDLNHMVVVNFICLPEREFEARKSIYPFYNNIDREGVVLYGNR